MLSRIEKTPEKILGRHNVLHYPSYQLVKIQIVILFVHSYRATEKRSLKIHLESPTTYFNA